MKSRRIAIILAGVLFLSGCKHVPESRTILLPEEELEQGLVLEGEEGDRYTVRKIYTEDYDSLWYYDGFTAFLADNKEHEVRLLRAEANELKMLTMDYRYGFFDATLLPIANIIDEYRMTWINDEPESINKQINMFSPDGKYLLYQSEMDSYIGPKLHLINLETMEEQILLDGDEANYSGDEFMILTAWSRDSSMLCYGFYPRNSGVWNSYNGADLLFYYLDMESGKVVNRLNYSYAGTAGKIDKLEDSTLHIDLFKDQILTVIEADSSYWDGMRLDVFSQKIQEGGMKTEGVVMPQTLSCMEEKIYLDVENGYFYAVSSLEEGIMCFHLDGEFQYCVPIDGASVVQDFLVLDGGEAIVTAEYSEDINREDICLYLGTGENRTRRVLYRNAGYIIRLQYDPAYHRLLAETRAAFMGEDKVTNMIEENAESALKLNRRIFVLEF